MIATIILIVIKNKNLNKKTLRKYRKKNQIISHFDYIFVQNLLRKFLALFQKKNLPSS